MKKAILVFIDGTICDTRHRHHLKNTEDFDLPEQILKDSAVPGSIACLQMLSKQYQIVYIGARGPSTLKATRQWLVSQGFPRGVVYLGESQEERLKIAGRLRNRYDFLAGIGDRWDDNELYIELGCISIMLQQFVGDWEHVYEWLVKYHRKLKIKENRIHLEGKVEGLSRVCPLLLSKFGDKLWEAYHQSVHALAENTRPERRIEDLKSLNHYHLDPSVLSDIARWYELEWVEGWQNNPVYGLQENGIIESSAKRLVNRVSRCYYAELWQQHGLPEIGYQIHCRTDAAWWDHPAWNPEVRFEQPKTLMQGDDCCIFIQYLPDTGEDKDA